MKKIIIKILIFAIMCLSTTTFITPEHTKANYGSVYWGYLYVTNASEREVWASLGWTCGCSSCGGCYNRSISIDWGDGTPWQGIAQASSAYHKYEKEGIYNVRAKMEYSCQRDQVMICFEDQTDTVDSVAKQAVLVPPGPFEITKTEAQCDSNNLSQNYIQWSQSENARGYFIFRNIKSAQFTHSWESNYIGYTENTNFTDKDILSNTEYRYSVMAINDYASKWANNGGNYPDNLENGLPIISAECVGPTFGLTAQPLTITAVRNSINEYYEYDVRLTPYNNFNNNIILTASSTKYCSGFGPSQICASPIVTKFLNNNGQEISSVNLSGEPTDVIMRISDIDDAIPTFGPNYTVLNWDLAIGGISGSINRSQVVSFKLLPFPLLANGDIYANGNINNLSLVSGAVASASGFINVSGTNYKLGSYSTNDNWQHIMEVMNTAKDRLISERATTLNGLNNVRSSTALTLDPSLEFVSPYGTSSTNFPDGRVWFVNGDLTLGELPDLFQPLETISFQGKGTIIVNGNVTIRNNLQYNTANSKSSLGIIATGDINIERANNLVGYYYTPQAINISRGGGASNEKIYDANFVAGDINFTDTGKLTINPDKNITNPPPGFQNLVMPTYSEVSP